jgi:uncharacterized protein YecE (DUF72 family)
VPKEHAAAFPASGSHLERYAARFSAVEINSSFYRPHRPSTYARWRESTPNNFKFSVKAPKRITHELRLVGTEGELDTFISEVSNLREKLGPILVQLPPSAKFSLPDVVRFFEQVRARFEGEVVCESRHESWFSENADGVFEQHRIARVAADPALNEAAGRPGGWSGLRYYRLHGSPRIYYSNYTAERLSSLSAELHGTGHGVPTWIIFDNTALGYAPRNALEMSDLLIQRVEKAA